MGPNHGTEARTGVWVSGLRRAPLAWRVHRWENSLPDPVGGFGVSKCERCGLGHPKPYTPRQAYHPRRPQDPPT